MSYDERLAGDPKLINRTTFIAGKEENDGSDRIEVPEKTALKSLGKPLFSEGGAENSSEITTCRIAMSLPHIHDTNRQKQKTNSLNPSCGFFVFMYYNEVKSHFKLLLSSFFLVEVVLLSTTRAKHMLILVFLFINL